MTRYARQIILPEVGTDGQNNLSEAHVLVIGAGGLGCPVLQYLVGAGIGKITLVDDDVVDQSNLHRQTLYNHDCIGAPKAQAAAQILARLNPDCKITPIIAQLTPRNAPDLVAKADIVLDCADSFAASYTLSDCCLVQNTPLISASVLALAGYVGGFCASAPSLRAVFPDLPSQAANCATAGVLGPVVGIIGAIQAQMALAVLLDITPSPLGQLVQYDAKNHRSSGFRFDAAPEPENRPQFIDAADITDADYVVELRDSDEAPIPATPNAIRIDVAQINTQSTKPAPNQRAVMVCKTGLRSWQAAEKLSQFWDGSIVLVALGNSSH